MTGPITDERVFDDLAWRLHKWGIRPDHFTYFQAPVYALMVALAYQARDNLDLVVWFGALQVFVVLLDGADGILARRTGTASRRGYLLDALFDILGIAITIWAVNILYPQYSNWGFILLAVNFLVYVQNEIQGTKSVTYTRGPVTAALFLERWYPQALYAGIGIPLLLGVVLLFTRLHWRQRMWNWYQFLTAGRRSEYKALPRDQRATVRGNGAFPPRRDPGPPSSPPQEPMGAPQESRLPPKRGP